MGAGEVVAVILAVVVAFVAGAVCIVLIGLNRSLRDLRAAVAELRANVAPLVADLEDTVTLAAYEVDRVERIVTTAEGIESRVDDATRAAYRVFTNPFVKLGAFRAGIAKGVRRFVGIEPAPGSRRRDRRRKGVRHRPESARARKAS